MAHPAKAAVIGLAGLELSTAEAELLAQEAPLGIILFKRNIASPAQVHSLIADCRQRLPHKDPLFLIDQEGGRVARLGPPHWDTYPAAAKFGAVWLKNRASACQAAQINGQLLAATVARLGFNVNCAPCLDLRFPDTHDAIGDRSFGPDPEMVTELGQAWANGMLEGGVLPVIKHMPGHGRARFDSHQSLPHIDTQVETLSAFDFAPFRNLKDLPLGMTAHLLFNDIDPDAPATHSSKLIQTVIRQDLGFNGFLFSDDLCMGALSGSPVDRAKASLTAGVDCALYCNGDISENLDVLQAIGPLASGAEYRLRRALEQLKSPPERSPQDLAKLTEERDRLLAAE